MFPYRTETRVAISRPPRDRPGEAVTVYGLVAAFTAREAELIGCQMATAMHPDAVMAIASKPAIEITDLGESF
jgi:hypothetical protein